MREISSDELKAIQLDILKDVHEFCVSHGIRYSLTGGSLIGAIRHKGYIPWDDDIDIMLPRPDYERFFQIYNSPKNEAINLKDSGLVTESFGKVCRKGIMLIDPEYDRRMWGAFIDLFPVDGFPSPEESARNHFDRLESINNRLGRYCPFYRTMRKNRILWFTKYIGKRILYFYPHSFLHLKQELDRMLKSQSFEDSPRAALYCGGDGWCEVMPKSIFESYTETSFEGRMFRIISEYDAYLKNVFGDYMQLPPEEARVNKHRYHYYEI